jgi:hypothetical protein
MRRRLFTTIAAAVTPPSPSWVVRRIAAGVRVILYKGESCSTTVTL